MKNATKLAMPIGVVTLLLTGCATLNPNYTAGTSSSPQAANLLQAGSSVETTAPTQAEDSPQVKDVLNLDSPTYELQIDPKGTLWLVARSADGANLLWRIDTASETTRSYKLPDGEFGWLTTHIRFAQDGAVWVSMPYTIVRFDPNTEQLSSTTLDLKVPDALPDALDPGTTLPGTWASAIAADGDGMLLARNHVPYLSKVDPKMQMTRAVDVDETHAGAADMDHTRDGRLVLLAAWDHPAAVIDSDGKVVAETKWFATRLLHNTDGLWALSADRGPMVAIDVEGVEPGTTVAWSRSNGTVTVTYDPEKHQLVAQTSTGKTAALQLEQGQGVSSCPPGTKCPVVEVVWDQVTDFTVADDGSAWLLRHGGHQLAHWVP